VLEVPVTYRSRGFDEGKKIRILRDPITWLVAIVGARFFVPAVSGAARAKSPPTAHRHGTS
jgi:hypothetical protein